MAVVVLSLIVTHGPGAYAESPSCFCELKKYTIETTPSLDCLEWEKRQFDACYGGDIQVSAVNRCGADLVIRETVNLEGQSKDQVIKAGDGSSWAENLKPALEPGDIRTLSITRNLQSQMGGHQLTLQAYLDCSSPQKKDSDDGCMQGAELPNHSYGLLLLGLLLFAWTRLCAGSRKYAPSKRTIESDG